jgi:tryptophan halogenase
MSASKSILRSRVAGLGVPYGLERSCKLTAGKVFGDRFLLSVHRNALKPAPVGRILDVLAPVGVPDMLAQQLEREFAGTDVVHFGYEAVDGGDICKVYFEHVENVRQALRGSRSPDQPTLVHRAWKWRLPATDGFSVTDYTWRRNAPGESVTDRIAQLCAPLGAAHLSARAVAAVRELVGSHVRFDDLMLLEVQEEGTVRHSFDLNLYPAELTVRGIAPVIDQLGKDFGLPAGQIAAVFDPVSDLALGHISGGSGRDGAPFVTIYFGVEAC